MKYKILLETRARREYLELPDKDRLHIQEGIDDLATNPRPPGAKKLSGIDGYRLRKGDYRILFTINDRSKEVRIYRIGHRREIYRER
jgi:mRNA interferase RelE/StbE